jgi:hypothetical protein
MTFHLADLQIKNLGKPPGKTGLPVAELIRKAIDEFLSEQKMSKK